MIFLKMLVDFYKFLEFLNIFNVFNDFFKSNYLFLKNFNTQYLLKSFEFMKSFLKPLNLLAFLNNFW